MKNIILAIIETYDRHDDVDQKYYYSTADALADAREMAREKDPKIVKGYFDNSANERITEINK